MYNTYLILFLSIIIIIINIITSGSLCYWFCCWSIRLEILMVEYYLLSRGDLLYLIICTS